MSQKTPADICIGTFLSWLIVIIILSIVPGPSKIIHGSQALWWHKQSCTVISSTIKQQQGNDPALLVRVQYEFDGKSFETTRSLTDTLEHLKHQTELFLRPSDKVKCRVNPQNPEEMIFDKEYIECEIFLLMFIFISLLHLVVAITWCLWIRSKMDSVKARFKFIAQKIVLILICVFILFFCGIATITGIGQSFRMLRSLMWPKVDAKVLSCSVSKVREEQSWNHKTDLSYSYEFDGQQYTSSRWSLFDSETTTRGQMRKAIRKMKIGDTVTCYVNPKKPEQAILDHQSRSFLGLPMLPILLAFVVFILWATLTDKKEKVLEDELLGEAIAIPQIPFHLQYELNRR
ncbi:MAG: DUF3592 domain-containing protein, partial [Planctomycetota bacterium]